MPHKITMENHKDKYDECLPDSYDNNMAFDHCDIVKCFHHKDVNYDIHVANLVWRSRPLQEKRGSGVCNYGDNM